MGTLYADYGTPGSQPKKVHAGENVVRARYSATATTSLSDIIACVKIPHLAIVTDVIYIAGTANANTALLAIGDSTNRARYFASATLATGVTRAAIGLGTQFSASDDATVRYDTIAVHFAGSAASALTLGWQFDLIVRYYVPV